MRSYHLTKEVHKNCSSDNGNEQKSVVVFHVISGIIDVDREIIFDFVR